MQIIKRSEWCPAQPAETIAQIPRRIVLHHSYSPRADEWRGANTVRAIWRYHVKTNGWADIGYHLIMSPNGTELYEGRPLSAIGAHCGGNPPNGVGRRFGNTNSIGICLIGDYDHEDPTPQAVLALGMLIDDLKRRFGICDDAVLGHFEAWEKPPKTCPGQHLAEAMGMGARWRKAFPGGR
jgi:hypothetical protein